MMSEFGMKYSALHVDFEKLETMISGIHRNVSESSANLQKPFYGIGFVPNVCCIYFYKDLRIEAGPWSSKGRSEPSVVANHIFNLNYCQAVDEATSEEILEAAGKELERRGYTKVDWQGK